MCLELPLAALLALSTGAAPPLAPLALPGATGEIGFDDMLFSPALGKVMVGAGRSGRLELVDPITGKVDSIEGFTTATAAGDGHGQGTTSADYGHGLVFASDRTAGVVDIVDPVAKRIVASVKLGGGPDYVRWVELLGEVWVTEPNLKVIEFFKLEAGSSPKLVSAGTVAVPDGPESLVIDAARGRAYTHTWHDATVVLDLKSHRVLERWPNGCKDSRGIALDEKRGFLFAGCDEGKAIVLDVAHGGKQLGSLPSGKGVDIIAYSPKLSRLYVPGGDDASLTVMNVSGDGKLTVRATFTTATDAHCVAADDAGNAYVCDPKGGRLLVLHNDARGGK